MQYRTFALIHDNLSKGRFFKVGRTFKRPRSAIKMANNYGKAYVLDEEGRPIYAKGFPKGFEEAIKKGIIK